MTIIQQNQVSESYARKLTENIRRTALNAKENIDKLNELITQAKNGNAHLALGYKSWTAYLSDTLSEAPMLLERDARQAFVLQLAAEGMSTRAIAPIVGASQMQVVRDVRAAETNVSPEPEFVYEGEFDAETGELLEASDVTPELPVVEVVRTVTGLDGKTYSAPSAKVSNRRALTDVAKDAGWDLRKLADRLDRIREDDRFSRNKEEVAAHLRGHLIYALETLHLMLDALPEGN